jgi:hypothetical protein
VKIVKFCFSFLISIPLFIISNSSSFADDSCLLEMQSFRQNLATKMDAAAKADKYIFSDDLNARWYAAQQLLKKEGNFENFYQRSPNSIILPFGDLDRWGADHRFTVEGLQAQLAKIEPMIAKLSSTAITSAENAKIVFDTLKAFRESQPNREMLTAMMIFETALVDCEELHDALKTRCDGTLTPEEFKEIRDSIHDNSFLLRTHTKGLFGWRQKQIKANLQETGPQSKKLIISLPLRPGKYSIDGKKEAIPQEKWLKLVATIRGILESKWRGTIVVNDSTKVDIMVTAVTKENDADAIAVNVTINGMEGSAGAVPDGGEKIGFSIQDEQSLSTESVAAVIAHEFGHVLGFLDRYHFFVDEEDCSFGYWNPIDQIMAEPSPNKHANAEDLGVLYRVYGLGQTIDINY